MSTTVDRRELQMSFDSKQFEKNVERTCESLERLKEDMNFDKEAEGFERVEKASKNMDFSPVERSLERVSHKFDLFGSIAFSVVNRLTNTIINLGENIVKNLTINNVTDGWARYEQQLKSVQAVMAALKADVGSTREEMELFDKVSEKMDVLATYADETSHSMSEMTSGISKFVSKTGDLDTATTAIMGIANWVSLAGGNAETAARMYTQLSQAASSYMKLQDWNSVKNANMDSMAIKQLFMDVAAEGGKDWEATLRKTEEGQYYIKNMASAAGELGNKWIKVSDAMSGAGEVTMKNFENTLTTGQWATKEVQMEVYRRLGEFASDFLNERNRLIENASKLDIDDSKFSIAKWKNSIRAIRDVVDEYKQAYGIVGDFNEEQQSQFFVDSQDKITEALSTVKNGLDAEALAFEGATEALLKYSSDSYTLSREAFMKSYEATTLTEAIESVKTTAKTQWAGIFEDIVGQYVDAKDVFTDLADELINSFVGPVYDIREAFDEWANLGKNVEFLDGIRNFADAIKSYKEPINKAIQNVFGDGEGMLGVLINVTDWFVNFTNQIKLSGSAAATFEKLWTVIFRFISMLGNVIQSTWPFIEKLFEIVVDVFDFGMDILDFLLSFNGDFSKTVELTDKAKGIFEKISPIIETIAGVLGTLAGIVGTVFKEAMGLIQTIADSGLFGVLSEGIKKIVGTLSEAFTELIPVATDFITNTLIPAITTAIKYIKNLFSSLFGGVEKSADVAIQKSGEVVKSVTGGFTLMTHHNAGGSESSSKYGGAKITGRDEDGFLTIFGGTREQQQALFEDYTAGLVDEGGNLLEQQASAAQGAVEKLKGLASETLISILTLLKSTADSINEIIKNLGTSNIIRAVRVAGAAVLLVILTVTYCFLEITDALTKAFSPAILMLILALAPVIALLISLTKIIASIGTAIPRFIRSLRNGGVMELGNMSFLETFALAVGAIGIFVWGVSKFLDVWTNTDIPEGKLHRAMGMLIALLAVVGTIVAVISYMSKSQRTVTNKMGTIGADIGKGRGFSGMWEGGEFSTSSDDAGGFFSAAPFVAIALILFAVNGFIRALGAIDIAEGIVGGESKFDKIMEALEVLTKFISTILGIVAGTSLLARLMDALFEKNTEVLETGKMRNSSNVFSGMFSVLIAISALITSLIPFTIMAQTMDKEELEAFNDILVTLGHFIGGLILALGIFTLLSKKTSKSESIGSGWDVTYKETSSTMLGIAAAMAVIIGAATVLFTTFYLLGSIEMTSKQIWTYLGIFAAIMVVTSAALLIVSRFSSFEKERTELSKTEYMSERSDNLMKAGFAIALLINACAVFLHAIAETAASVSGKDLDGSGRDKLIEIALICLGLLLVISGLLVVVSLFSSRNSKTVGVETTKSGAQNILMSAIAITVVMNGLAILVGALGLVSLSDKITESIGKLIEIVLAVSAAIYIISSGMAKGKINIGSLLAVSASLVLVILALAEIAKHVVSDINGGDFKTGPILTLIGWVSVIGALLIAVAAIVAKYMSSSSYGLMAFGIFEALIASFIGLLAAFSILINAAAAFTSPLVELSKVKMADVIKSLTDLLEASKVLNKIKISATAATSMGQITEFFNSLTSYKDKEVEHVTTLAKALSDMSTAIITVDTISTSMDDLKARFDAILNMYKEFFEELRGVLSNNPLTSEEGTALSSTSNVMTAISTMSNSISSTTIDIQGYIEACASMITTLTSMAIVMPQIAMMLDNDSLTESIKSLRTQLYLLSNDGDAVSTTCYFTGLLGDLARISEVFATNDTGVGMFERMATTMERIAKAFKSVNQNLLQAWIEVFHEYSKVAGSAIGANDGLLGALKDSIDEIGTMLRDVMNGEDLTGALGVNGMDSSTQSANNSNANKNTAVSANNTTNYYDIQVNVDGGNPDDVVDAIWGATERADDYNRATGNVNVSKGTTKAVPNYNV